jgi:bifunctional non-homologous end joining protein LigD
MPRFVIQHHHSRSPHYDLRLERDGVYVSWAVPKGIPLEPGVRRLAVRVEDHPLAYGDFEGVIPPGRYGTGRVEIYDRGECEIHSWSDEYIIVSFSGMHVSSRYCLTRFRRKGEREWLIFMAPDE